MILVLSHPMQCEFPAPTTMDDTHQNTLANIAENRFSDINQPTMQINGNIEPNRRLNVAHFLARQWRRRPATLDVDADLRRVATSNQSATRNKNKNAMIVCCYLGVAKRPYKVVGCCRDNDHTRHMHPQL
jgi:hypothetical protein